MARALRGVLLAALFAAGCGDGNGAPQTVAETPAARALVDAHRARFPSLRASEASAVRRLDGALSPVVAARPGDRRGVVALPALADGSFHLADERSGMTLEVALHDALPVAAQVGGGYITYPGGHASGADVLHRPTAIGTEDYLVFAAAPRRAEVRYRAQLGDAVAGLRLVGNTLEFIDAGGSPRLRVAPPAITGSDGKTREALLAVEGCAVDESPAAPWDRPPTEPGARSCTVRVTWDAAGLAYPALLDPPWTTTGSMATAREEHRAVQTTSGGKTNVILVVGGANSAGTDIASCELYNIGTGVWSAAQTMSVPRRDATLTKMTSLILVAGGFNAGNALATAATYNPATGTWSATTGNMATARAAHAGAYYGTSPDRVLLCGGNGAAGKLASCEIYNATSRTFSAAAAFTGPRYNLSTTVLLDGRVLLNGGCCTGSGVNQVQYTQSAQVYNSINNSWSDAGSATMQPNTYNYAYGDRLSDGRVFAFGYPGAQIYNPSNNSWAAAPGAMVPGRSDGASSILQNGNVAIAGGFDSNSNVVASAERYDSVNGGFRSDGPMTTPRHAHTVTRLGSDNRLIAVGGIDANSNVLASAEILSQFALAHTCTGDADCESGYCVDGVCCNAACGGQCQACNLNGLVGTCSAVTGAPVGGRPACAGSLDGSSCVATCNGVNQTACVYGGGACTEAHATGSCSNGSCGALSCSAGWGNCDGVNSNGCEDNTTTDPDHCGACTNAVCSSNHMQTRTCAASVCNGTCTSPFQDCNGNKLTDGCEINVTTDPDHCGACTNAVCSSNHMATRTCAVSVCNGTCTAPFQDCNGNKLTDGCEINVTTDPDHCGACANAACSANHMQTRTCAASVCNGSCTAPFQDCNGNKLTDGCEDDVTSDPDHCGACANAVCSANHMATRTCAASVCNGSCTAPFQDCNGNKLTDGCEDDVTSDPDHCGACANAVCSANHMATRTCAASVCNGGCATGFGDCNSNKLTDGCEVTLATDPDHCGACTAVCSANNMATRTCAASLCNGSCATNFVDCNGNKLTDGCEANTMAQGNCGGCGVTCNGTTCNPGYCNAGTCGTLAAERCSTSTCELVGQGCAVVDTDGDGLSDAWETSNSGGGSSPPNVPYIDSNCNGQWDAAEPLLAGTSPTVPDVYVVYDWMDWSTPGNACSVATDCTGLGSAHAGEICSGGSCVFSCAVDGDCTARGGGHAAERCMSGVCKHTHDPNVIAPGALAAAVTAYQNRGFVLHLIPGAAKPHSLVASFRAPGTLTVGCEGISGGGVGQYAASLYDLKNASPAFPAPYNRAYHYALFAHYSSCDTTAHCLGCPSALNPDGSVKNAPSRGQSGIAEISGNDFIVSLGNRFQDVALTAGTFSVGSTFMHELGHNLGLHHGGGIDQPCNTNADCTGVACTTTAVGKYCLNSSDTNWKPNYLSVMNYRYQFTGIQSASTVGGALPSSQRLDYSSQVLPAGGNTPGLLDESNTPNQPPGDPGLGLSEPAGLGSNSADLFTFTDALCDIPPTVAPTSGPVDWDGDGAFTSTAVAADTNSGVDHICPSVFARLPGASDWSNGGSAKFTYKFQCTPYFADGPAPVEGITGGEISATQAQQAGVADPILGASIDVRPGCTNNWLTLGPSSGNATTVITGTGSSGCVVCGLNNFEETGDTVHLFTDPAPAGVLVTSVSFDIAGLDAMTGGLHVYLNDPNLSSEIGYTLYSQDHGFSDSCGNCDAFPRVTVTNPAGIPGWQAGGSNRLELIADNFDLGGEIFLTTVTVTVGYAAGGGNVAVAAYGSTTLDVTTIDTSTVRFAGAPALATAVSDLDGDGKNDLTGQFDMSALHLGGSANSAGWTALTTARQTIVAKDVVAIVQSQQSCQGGSSQCTGVLYDGGCWYVGSAGQSCATVCAAHNLVRNTGFPHLGDGICKLVHPDYTDGPNDGTVECCNNNSHVNHGANGATPDVNYSNAACQLACDCNGDVN